MTKNKLAVHATNLRNQAAGPRSKGQFADAAKILQTAIDDLEEGLFTARQAQDKEGISDILKSLSATYGSLGGTWRDARDFEKAKLYYDEGNGYEDERRSGGAKDSYNLLQQLVVRLLDRPSLIDEAKFVSELNGVLGTIRTQFKNGREDSWGLADLVLAQILCGLDADRVIADLEERNVNKGFYQSTYKVVIALIAEGLGKGTALVSRLEDYARALQRQGGLREDEK